MNSRVLFIILAAVAASFVLVSVQASAETSDNPLPVTAQDLVNMAALDSAMTVVLDPSDPTVDPPPFKDVKPHEYDPAHTTLVQAEWSGATGCPTDATVATGTSTTPTGTYSDPVCSGTALFPADTKDDENDGLVLVKTGPSTNNAAALAELKGVKGITLTELGYDLRKPPTGSLADIRGSHCSFHAPRFDIVTPDDHVFFVACLTATSYQGAPGGGWVRLRWGSTAVAMPGTTGDLPTAIGLLAVKRITIVFDEGQDGAGAPDHGGVAILDNIDVNGTLDGHGPDESEP